MTSGLDQSSAGSDDGVAFEFLRRTRRPTRPRSTGRTEIRGPFYSAYGPRHLADILDAAGAYVDSVKLGPPITVMPRRALRDYLDVSHRHDVLVSTGGVVEIVMTQGSEAVDRYLRECVDLGFDIVEVSTSMLALSLDDFLLIIGQAKALGLRVTAEIGVQFGAGSSSSIEELEAEGLGDSRWAVHRAQQAIAAGADLIMVESEGITERVREWRTEVVGLLVTQVGLDRLMFEAADPPVFAWYVKNYGPNVNLFIDVSQIFQLECLRSGLSKTLFGRVHTYGR